MMLQEKLFSRERKSDSVGGVPLWVSGSQNKKRTKEFWRLKCAVGDCAKYRYMRDFISIATLIKGSAWVETESECSSCRGPACCEIAPPFLTQSDIVRISRLTALSSDGFAELRFLPDGRAFSQMRGTEDGACCFFNKSTRKCEIYE